MILRLAVVLPVIAAAVVKAVAASEPERSVGSLFAPDLTRLAEAREEVGDPLVLVRDGASVASIVTTDRLHAREGAFYLQSVIRRMTGVELSLVLVRDGQDWPALPGLHLVDDGDATNEAFSVETSADAVVLRGRVDFAAYDWAERILGVRTYWDPQRGGEVIPETKGLAVPRVAYADRPVFAYRVHYPFHDRLWVKVAKVGASFDLGFTVHSTPSGVCYGSPEAFDDYVRRIEERIAGVTNGCRTVDTRLKTVSVSPWDEPYGCACRWCRTLRSHASGVAGDASPIVWGTFLPRLSRWLAERHPDYRIVFLPYWNYMRLPRRPFGEPLRLDNATAFVCNVAGVARLASPEIRAREEAMMRGWKVVTGRKIVIWDYACWPAEESDAPYVCGRTIRSHLDAMREVADGVFICGTGELARLSLSLYVWQRCLWNPDLDVEAVYDEFCRRMFGPAAGIMRRVVALQESEWRPPRLDFSPETVVELHRLLLAAQDALDIDASPQGAVFRRRFAYYASGFSRLLFREAAK